MKIPHYFFCYCLIRHEAYGLNEAGISEEKEVYTKSPVISTLLVIMEEEV